MTPVKINLVIFTNYHNYSIKHSLNPAHQRITVAHVFPTNAEKQPDVPNLIPAGILLNPEGFLKKA